eukprot:3071790-Rhodomonas_salina.1
MQIAVGELLTLTLPGFTSPSDEGFAVTGTFFSQASWNNETASLILTADQLVVAGTLIDVTVPSVQQIVLPAAGVRTNEAALTINSNAVAGPVLPTSITSTQPVGSFLSSTALAYSPSVAGAVTNISVSFTAKMSFAVGDVLTLVLPGFTGTNASGTNTSGDFIVSVPPGIFGALSWDPVAEEVQIVFASSVPADQDVQFTIVRGAGIALPSDGIRHGTSSNQICTNAVDGPVPCTSFVDSPAVGSFFQVGAIAFAPAKANAPTELSFSFAVQSNFRVGDTFTFTLPGFSRTDGPLTVSMTYLGNPVWMAAKEQLTLTLTAERAPQYVISATLVGLRLPSIGIRENSRIFTLAVDAFEGEISDLPLMSPAPVGAFSAGPALSFTSEVAGTVTGLNVSFAALMDIRDGEMLQLKLPGFGGDTVLDATFAVDPASCVSSVTWNSTRTVDTAVNVTALQNVTQVLNGNNVTVITNVTTLRHYSTQVPLEFPSLTANVSCFIPTSATFTLTIPSSVNITLPDVGVRLNQPSLTFTLDANAGPVPETSIPQIEPVGAFADVGALQFVYPARAGEGVGITFSFTAYMPLQAGDNIVFTLPAFGGNSSGTITTVGSLFGSGAWDVAAYQLSVAVASSIDALTAVDMTILADDAVALPVEGIRVGSTGFFVGTDAVAGPVRAVSIASVQQVGYFSVSTLKFGDAPRAGEIVPMELVFVAGMNMAANDNITLTLRGFGASSFASATKLLSYVNSSGNGSISVSIPFDDDWDAGATVLTLKLRVAVPAGVSVVFQLATDAGMRLPVDGVRYQSTDVLIATDALAGPVPDTPIADVQPVGFFDVARVSFVPARAGSVTDVVITLDAKMDLVPGDRIDFIFGHLTSNVTDLGPHLESSPAGAVVEGSWFGNTSNLSLTIASS